MPLLLGLYLALGGFNAIDFSIENRDNIRLLGLTYRGTPQDNSMMDTFKRVESLIEKYPKANLHTVYYTEPAGKLDTLQVFIGIEYRVYPDLPEGMEEKNISCTKVLIADIKSHKWVMPTPQKVKEALEAYARKEGVKTQGIYVDKIIDKNQVKVIAPLVNGL